MAGIHTRLALGPVALFKTSTGHNERMNMKKINHNDLLPWFTDDHDTLPKAYLDSCRKFFEEISNKQQATSSPQSDAMIDPLQKINRKELKKL